MVPGLLACVLFCCLVNRVVDLQSYEEFISVWLTVNQLAHEGDTAPFNSHQRADRQLCIQNQAEAMNGEVSQSCFAGGAGKI